METKPNAADAVTYKDLVFEPGDLVEVRAVRNPSFRGVDLFVLAGRRLLSGLVFEEYAPGSWPRPSLGILDAQAQALLDELYRAGFRPTEEGSAGERAAMREHIADLRNVSAELFKLTKRRGIS